MSVIKIKDNNTWKVASGPEPTGLEEIENKVTTISSSSTDTQYPTAKAVYNIVGNIDEILESLMVGDIESLLAGI